MTNNQLNYPATKLMTFKRRRFLIFFTFLAFLLILIGLIVDLKITKLQENKLLTENIKKSSKIYSVIIPHHDLVKRERNEFWQKISSSISAKNIILVSPNHFNAGGSQIITTDKTWQLSGDKTIKPALSLVKTLVEKDLVSESDSAFVGEHGIINLLEELKTYFPDANLAPIIIKNKTSKGSLDSLQAQILTSCQNQCLMIASVDFSHYQPQALADLHDIFAIRALSNLDFDSILKDIEVDSPESLYLATLFAKTNSAKYLKVVYRTNSGKIEKQRDSETTTHLFAYFSQDQKVQSDREKSTTFLFAGDIMLDRLVNHRFPDDELSQVFANFGDRVFWGTDLAIANLEGPISDQPISDDISPSNLTFNFPLKSAEVLKNIHLEALSLANNHTLNAGLEGMEATKKMLDNQGIAYFGHQKAFDETSVFRSTKGDLPVSVIGVNLLEGMHQQALKKMIEEEKSSGRYVIIFPHWGEEYQETHSKLQEEKASDWITWGADLIIGSHPHVVQDAEIINGKPVFYSLGNFVFDQTFSEGTQKGLIIAGKITEYELILIPLPVQSVELQPELIRGLEKTKVLENIVQNFESGQNIEFDPISGILKLENK